MHPRSSHHIFAKVVTKQVTFQPKVTQVMEVDDDEPDGIFSSSLLRVAGYNNVAGVVDEYELIDDAHTYFPLMNARGEPLDKNNAAAASEQPYIPGQQVIEPGFTRYRVDVQYMGSDFDGWYKSTEKRSRLLRNDGVTAKAAKTSGEDDNDELLYAAERKHRAKTVLEDALAIALDVERVKVEAGVIPEVGCSVRRLTCHVDVPDSNPLQPRTIMQRATAWLEKKQSPIAILSCHPCRNQQFHARHSGTKRVYVYRILNRIAPPLFDAGLQWHVDRFLDVERMQRFADRLQGTMDYGYFADAKMAHALRTTRCEKRQAAAATLLKVRSCTKLERVVTCWTTTQRSRRRWTFRGRSAPRCARLKTFACSGRTMKF
ncbi:glycosomal malate dehydrogenase, putative [Bodo saltans]|uniref:Glycosomal malate dehydrogenase, putative n=1 Tax=Bodo saltans TaxID=75058 RepID=A0A0S4KKT4_BODSA|nr:glycosomal malate dehydrogenase, putative [Bodo saltans]|eukprot:CUI15075.1 glycosomal malate dehydrogenase, putative [Bodo saltans]